MSRLRWFAVALLLAQPVVAQNEPAWVKRSNVYTNRLLAIELAHSPESGSRQGVARFDTLVSDPSLADALKKRQELVAALASLPDVAAAGIDSRVAQDVQILRKAFDLAFRSEDYAMQHEVPFVDASAEVFEGLRGLLDDQVTPQRRAAALVRLRKYAGVEPGSHPLTQTLKARVVEQMAKADVIYPAKDEVITELGRNENYLSGIHDLFIKYRLQGWGARLRAVEGRAHRLRPLGNAAYLAEGNEPTFGCPVHVTHLRWNNTESTCRRRKLPLLRMPRSISTRRKWRRSPNKWRRKMAMPRATTEVSSRS